MINEVHHGDSLEIIKRIPSASVDAVITDPPYMIGATSVGNADAKAGTWADMENAAYWFAAWYVEAWRVLKDTGYFITFGNWRSLPTMLCALAKSGMPATSCLIWDKEWIGPAAKNQLRPTYEVVLLSGKPGAIIPNRSASDIVRCRWMAGNCKVTEHPAEKPVALIEHLIELVTQPGATVLDPFLGSGTTAVAALRTGRQFIGIERDQRYAEIARQRILGGEAQLLQAGDKQSSIFDMLESEAS